MPEPDDITLLRKYAGGDDSAFTTLFERYVHLAYSVALRQTRNPSHAEEVTQVVFILLARKAKSLSPRIVLSGWLYQAARLTAASLIQREIRRQHREQEVYMQTLNEPDTSLWEQISPLLDEAMGRLGEQDRNAIVLRFFENRTPEEVAVALNLNEATARKRVSRALEKLRTFFAKRGVVLTAAIIAGTISANSVQAAPAAFANSATAVAIVKGTLTSGSILTLLKGALNRMAWAKAKVAAIAGTVLFLGAGATILELQADHTAGATAGPDIQGVWEGTATVPWISGVNPAQRAHCRVVWRIAQTNGVYSASVDEIDLGKRDIRATRVIYKYPYVQFYLGDCMQCQAKLNSNATAMTFEFNRERELDLVVRRTNAPDAVPEQLKQSEFVAGTGGNLQGYWEGGWKRFFPLNLKVAAQSDGGYRGELDMPELGVSHWPLTVTDGGPGQTTFEAMSGGWMFQGRLNSRGTRMIGMFTLGLAPISSHPLSYPFTFSRAEYHPEETPPESDYAFSAAADLQGHWTTEMDASLLTIVTDGRLKKLPLNLDIAKAADGTYSAALVLPLAASLGAGDPMPVTILKNPLPDVHLAWQGRTVVFDGKLSEGKLLGKWSAAGQSFAVTFERRAQ